MLGLFVLATVSLVSAQDPGSGQEQAPAAPEPGPDQALEGLDGEEGPVEEGPVEEPPAAEAAPEPPAAEPAPPSASPAEAAPAAEVEAAPEITAPAESPPETESEELIVTGTRIRRTAFAASAPVDVVDRKQLEYTGAANLSDVVKYLTTSQGTGPSGALSAGGTVSVNLRGLGEGASLVLVNGRRVNPSAGGIDNNFGDLSVIPLAAVERIEVLKAGASALYGADAVGGVVNVITRKNWSGMRVQVDGQTTEEFDQQDFTTSAAFGASAERSRVLLASSYFRRNELTADERDWTEGKYISTQGSPGAYVFASPTGMATAAGAVPDPACANVPGSMPAMGSSAASTVCAFEYRKFASLGGNLERANVFGSAEYDLTNHTSAFAEASASRTRGDGIGNPSPPLVPFPLVPADHVDNPFRTMTGGRTAVLWVGRALGASYGATRSPVADDTFRGVLGIKGDFEGAATDTVFESWEWELFTMMGISRYRYTFQDTIKEPLIAALNSCSDPADLSGCFNPFYSAIDGTGTANSQKVINGIIGEMMILNDHALQTYNAGMSGSLFELPGGDLGLAFGGEVRHEWRTGEFDHDANEDRLVFYVGNPDNSAARDVYSGYLELRWPFYNGVELQTAGRLEHYTDIERTALSPFAGLTLTPAEWVGRNNAPKVIRRLYLRGNASSSFRAPSIRQSDSNYSTVPTALRLNPSSALSTFLPVRRYGNPKLKPETAIAFSGGFTWLPIDELTLTADLWHYDYVDRIDIEEPQQAINQDMLSPDPRVRRDVNGNVVGVNVNQINVKGSTITNGIDFGVIANFGEGPPEDRVWNFSFGAQGTYTLTYDIPRRGVSPRSIAANAQTMTAARILPPADCEGSSAVDFDMDPNNNAQNDQDTCHVAGKRNAANFAPAIPQLRATVPVTFSASGHSGSVMGHYISAVEDDVEPNQDGSFDQIDAWLSFDLQYGYTLKDVIGEEVQLRIGCYNVLDTEPSKVNGSAAALEASLHEPRGRMFYAKLTAGF